MIERVVIAGGGSGGHLFPGIAVVEELRRRNPALQALFVGTERGIEARLLPKLGEELALLDVEPLMGRSAGQLVSSVARLPRSAAQAFGVLRRARPQLVLGLGGYASGPLLATAAAMRLPTALLEQNAQVGLTNRMLAHTVGRAYLTYEETRGLFGDRRARVLGNPVRRAFVEAAQLARHDPQGAEARAKRILILGGSQGARCLNEMVPDALSQAGVADLGAEVVHQTGSAMVEQVTRRYRELGIRAQVVPFIDDMARAYASASLLIARAGATTLAELCSIGRPAILIPFPFAAEDHQLRNAQALARVGAAVALPEPGLQVEQLAGEVRSLVVDRERREQMAAAARALGRPDAAAAIVDDLQEWLRLEDEGTAGPSAANGAGGLGATGSSPGVDSAPLGAQREFVSRRARVRRRSQLRIRPLEGFAEVAHQ